MCFLKTLKPLENLMQEKEPFSDESSSHQNSENTKDQKSYLNKLFLFSPPPLVTQQHQLLMRLTQLVHSNNSHIQALSHKLEQSEKRLVQTQLQLDQMRGEGLSQHFFAEKSQTSIGQVAHDQECTLVDPLIVQLFGKKKYLYKLQLAGEVPSVIFKERNISITVNLVDQSSQKILNSNIIHLCLGVCDANAQWITENKCGQGFMKGKTEVQMYHGEGSFLKIYPRDVSRAYPQGKINFVVYSKPSLIQFSSSSSGVEKLVESDLIEPLLIKDVTIRAKKKD